MKCCKRWDSGIFVLQHPSPYPHFADINSLLQFSCLCLCLATIQYHRTDNCIHNSCFCLQTYVFVHTFSRPCIATLPSVILPRIFSNLPSHSTKAPQKEKSATTSISSPSTSKLLQLSVVMILVFLILKYIPAFSLSVLSFLIMNFNCSFFPAISVVSSAYLRLLTVLPAILTPT